MDPVDPLCISTGRFFILINGSPAGFLSSKRGLRQGDPLSPYLFLLIMKILSSMIKNSTRKGWIRGFKVKDAKHNCVETSHILYAAHTLLLCGADRTNVTFESGLAGF